MPELQPQLSKQLSAGNFNQRAAQINKLLSCIYKYVNEDELLLQRLDYLVKKKGENDRTRMTRFFKFAGPDDDTIAVLESNLARWLSQPASFWVRPQSLTSSVMSPRAAIVKSYIHTERDDA